MQDKEVVKLPASGEYKPYRHEPLKAAITRDTDVRALCESINISHTTFYRAMRGGKVFKDRIEAIAQALGIPTEKVFIEA